MKRSCKEANTITSVLKSLFKFMYTILRQADIGIKTKAENFDIINIPLTESIYQEF
jgi:hypothetical protein